jgi:hypothetical protein
MLQELARDVMGGRQRACHTSSGGSTVGATCRLGWLCRLLLVYMRGRVQRIRSSGDAMQDRPRSSACSA